MHISIGDKVEWEECWNRRSLDGRYGRYCTGTVMAIDSRNPKNVMAYVKHDAYYSSSWWRNWISVSKLTRVTTLPPK